MEELIVVKDGCPVVNTKVSAEVREMLVAITKLEKQKKEFTAKLQMAMELNKISKLETDDFAATYVAPMPSMKLNSSKLKNDYPEVYAACQYETASSPYVKLTAKAK